MKSPGLLVSFFVDKADALRAFRKLNKQGFRKLVLISKSAAGRTEIKDLVWRDRASAAAIGAFSLGLLSTVVFGGLIPGLALPFTFRQGVIVVLAAAVGAGVGWSVALLLRRSIDSRLIARHSEWVLPEEYALYLQERVEDLGVAIEILRAEGHTPPAVFPVHPDHGFSLHKLDDMAGPASHAELRNQAAALAGRLRGKIFQGEEPGFTATLDKISNVINQVQTDFSQAERLEQNVSVSAEWILDNAYIIEAHIQEVRKNLTQEFYEDLPIIKMGSEEVVPRVLAIARVLVALTDNRIDREDIHDFLEAYQQVQILRTVELWAFPLALRIALIEQLRLLIEHISVQMREHEQADFWANRLLMATRYEPNQLFKMLANFAQEFPEQDSYFASQIIGHLYDEDTSLVTVQKWLEHRLGKEVREIMVDEQAQQAAVQLSIGNAVTTLRDLALLDWRKMFESLSAVEAELGKDPSGVYAAMDFATRDRYRKFVESVAREGGVEEQKVAEEAVSLARRHKRELREGHVGYFLIDKGREELRKAFSVRPDLRSRLVDWVRAYHTVLYLSAIATTTIFISGIFLTAALLDWSGPSALLILAVLFGLLPASQLAVYLVNDLVTRLIPPWVLPKLSYKDQGIPSEYRTLVIVPMLLAGENAVREELEKLEIRFLANPDRNLLFGLFSDHLDSNEPLDSSDGKLLELAKRGIISLNEKYQTNRFYLFHREREWSETEGRYIGWERKRGKLMDLNRYLVGKGTRSGREILRVGSEGLLSDVRFVITLDSDTQLPKDSARRMVETLAHPLNQPVLNDHGEIEHGYTMIQPRISTSLPSAMATPFSRLFNDPIGVDPYTSAISDVYQDLAGEGSFIGKGIYDFRAFHEILSGRFPEGHLLSHDLLEGAHVRVGLASDIELFDDFPPNYLTYIQRQHRWIRGDWQIASWVTSKVPNHEGARVANPLDTFNRWKIFDNLRRSLVPVGAMVMLATSWMHSVGLGAAASLLTGLMFFINSFVQPFTWPSSILHRRLPSWRELFHRILRSIVEVALLPHRVIVDLDAIVRVWYRKLISKRHLLEWTTMQASSLQATRKRRDFILHLMWFSASSIAMAVLLAVVMPGSLKVAAPFLILWTAIPLIGVWLDREEVWDMRRRELPEADRVMLRILARKTWRYFDDFVGPETHWLPPDNYQMSHKNKRADRTSPTNIGLWMTSTLAALDFGFLTIDQLVEKLSRTMVTIDRLERFNGHLLNWYNIETLEALEPRYVSMVDSGNLLAGLWTLEQGMDGLIERPIVDRQALLSIKDTIRILEGVIETEGLDGEYAPALNSMERLCVVTDDPLKISTQLDEMYAQSGESLDELLHVQSGSQELKYWVLQLQEQVSRWRQIFGSYLAWLPHFRMDQSGDGHPAGKNIEIGLQSFISLGALARADQEQLEKWWLSTASKRSAFEGAQPTPTEAVRKFEAARRRARQTVAELMRMKEEFHNLAGSINMRFLYDDERRLFSIGYNVGEKRLDNSFYDLLASEARLSSYIAIARGDVPIEHWLALNRPYRTVGRRRALLSWTGTMFEYLMPAVFLKAYPNSLLDQGMDVAVALQEQYGKDHDVPWGISESAFGDLDYDQNYMYRAFGVPDLGLKRGLEERLVVAPYATVLALMEDPRAAVANLRRLYGLGMENPYGLYEAVDFSRPAEKPGASGVIVHSVMAHHQGMSLLALDNALNQALMRQRFHSDVRVKSTEPLLYERIPTSPALYHLEARDQPPVVSVFTGTEPLESIYESPATTIPEVQILSNGSYNLMITNAGGGYSQWRDIDITRWRADTTRDHWGSFFYLRDVDTGHVWSPTFHPTDEAPDEYQVVFPLDRATFNRIDDGVKTSLDVVISPEDDVELRQLKLRNISNESKLLEVTSYIELAMASRSADRQHPAFQKLFVETEVVPEHSALIARRRKQDPDQQSIFVGHELVIDNQSTLQMQYETDRKKFIGRGRDTRDPQAAVRTLSNSAGYVLDPILSQRRMISLPPAYEVRCTLVLAAAGSRAETLALLDKFQEYHSIERAFEVAWAQAQLELRMLRIEQEQVRQFRQAASHVLFPNRQLRPPGERLRANTKSQSALWAYGISGDLPIASVTIGQERDIILVRQMLQAHTYWRKHGLIADLLIINEQEGGYEQNLHDRLIQMAQAHSEYTGMDQPGGVFVRSTDRISPEDLTLMLSASRVSLLAARGSLAQQLSTAEELIELPERIQTHPQKDEPSSALSHVNLVESNGIGGFSEDGHEYIIRIEPGIQPAAPWINVIANPKFGTLISEQGSGFTWHENSQRNRLSAWSNDPVSDPPSEAVFIRDEHSGEFWTPTPLPNREREPYRIRHGAGYSVFEHNSHGIEQRMTVFVPVDDTGGDPIRIQKLELCNESSRTRKLSVTFYLEWTLGEDRDKSQMHVQTEWDAKLGVLKAYNHYRSDVGALTAFMALDRRAEDYTADRMLFLGRNGNISSPVALQRQKLAQHAGSGLDPCGALRVTLELEPGQTEEILCLLGEADSDEHAEVLISKYRKQEMADRALKATQAWWDDFLGTIQVEVPVQSANLLLNRWLLYQDLSCRLWGRSAFYQSGGAFGFRDQLQDVMALLYSAPQIAREHIIRAAGRQFKQGDVQHWWHPPGNAGVRTRISDDPLWLPYVVSQYVSVTGDVDILRENIPFLEGKPLEDDESDRYFLPEESQERADLYEHCRRALEQGSTSGEHGLPLIGFGDWNDGLNRIGQEGRGESVWLAWFLAETLDRFAGLTELYTAQENALEYRKRAEELRQDIRLVAWDGDWYLRAFTDAARPVGAGDSDEGRIFSIPQSWATLAGNPADDHAREALDSVWKKLVKEEDQLALLFSPPFNLQDPDPGYVRGYPPGVRENGGQYTHAALWLALALTRQGDGERAVRLLNILNPLEHSLDIQNAIRYEVEPYVVAADIYNLAGDVGRGGWTWYTGSAGWMYRVWLEGVLGFKLRGNKLTLDPAIPPNWENFQLTYRHGKSVYNIRVENPDGTGSGVKWIELDGRRLEHAEIELEHSLIKHEVVVRL